MLNTFVKEKMMNMPEAKEALKRPVHAQLWDYTLVVEPDRETSEKMELVRQELHDLFGAEMQGSQPHIRLASFQAKEMMEEVLIRWIGNICQLENAFEVRVNNYSGVPPHSLILRIQDASVFSGLVNRLRMIDTFVQSNDCPPMQFTRAGLSIAEGLPEAVYAAALSHYSGECFFASFKVSEVLLVKRWWEGDNYDLVRRFHLMA